MTSASDGTLLLVTCRIAAPGGWFDRSDNGACRVDLREGGVVDQSGAAAPGGPLGGFRVSSRLPPDLIRFTTWPISTSASAGPLSVVLSRVDAWCDHTPGYGREPDNREMLLLTTTLRNTSGQPLTVRLDRVFISFAESRLGVATTGFFVQNPVDPPNGVVGVVLQPGETRIVKFRGNGVFPEGRHRERLHVTLQFSAGNATVAVRNSGVIQPTS